MKHVVSKSDLPYEMVSCNVPWLQSKHISEEIDVPEGIATGTNNTDDEKWRVLTKGDFYCYKKTHMLK